MVERKSERTRRQGRGEIKGKGKGNNGWNYDETELSVASQLINRRAGLRAQGNAQSLLVTLLCSVRRQIFTPEMRIQENPRERKERLGKRFVAAIT